MTPIEVDGRAGRSDELNGRGDGGGNEQAGGEESADDGKSDLLQRTEIESHFGYSLNGRPDHPAAYPGLCRARAKCGKRQKTAILTGSIASVAKTRPK